MGRAISTIAERCFMAEEQTLKDDHRTVLSLRYFEQLPYSDIGTAMHCSEGSARVMFYRAKQALKAGIP